MRLALLSILFGWIPTHVTAQRATSPPTQGRQTSTEASPPVDESARRYWVGAQLHATYLSALFDNEALQLSGGYAIAAGAQFRRAGLVVVLENTWFPQPELAVEADKVFKGVAQGILVALVGFDVRFADERLRFQMAAGPTVLLRNTIVDNPGTLGFAFDFRPVGIRVPLRQRRTLVVDPLSFSLQLPDLSGIPLLLLHFRTTLTIEFDVGDR